MTEVENYIKKNTGLIKEQTQNIKSLLCVKLPGYCILLSLVMLSNKSLNLYFVSSYSHDNFSVESSKDSYLKVIMKGVKVITFLLTIVTVVLVVTKVTEKMVRCTASYVATLETA